MADIVASAEVQFEVTGHTSVEINVSYHDTNWVTLFKGTSWKWTTEERKDDGQPPVWSLTGPEPVVQIAADIKVKIAGASRIQVILQGEESLWIYPDEEGYFSIPRRVIGSGADVVAYDQQGDKKVAVNINNGRGVGIETVTTRIRPQLDGVQVLTNAAVINIEPKARFGQGTDVFTEAAYTAAKSGVTIKARTTEGEYAASVTVVNVKTGEEAIFDLAPGSVLELDFPEGRFHVFATWRNFRDSFGEYPWWYGGKG
jgi:hypothetical protein